MKNEDQEKEVRENEKEKRGYGEKYKEVGERSQRRKKEKKIDEEDTNTDDRVERR